MNNTRNKHLAADCVTEECEYHETCSLCCVMTDINRLKPMGEWEMVCPTCRAAAKSDNSRSPFGNW